MLTYLRLKGTGLYTGSKKAREREFLCPLKQCEKRGRSEELRERERRRESELNGATRGRVSILECTCRRNWTRTASESRKEREREERDALHAASGKGQQPRCGRSDSTSFLLKARASRPTRSFVSFIKARDRSDSCRARNAPKLAEIEQTAWIVSPTRDWDKE
ncbi:hypothetical protein DBV15_01652 [Temnothorax longispinosus]|uniref:Uncharacterized protein n=1 Tax=Temnothorax longispinosus TaxID=300112 RepID=A0A4S2L0U8_9HYME|nr:hypothetical protein DBV15_01652 [Temnothorax longispinosus]